MPDSENQDTDAYTGGTLSSKSHRRRFVTWYPYDFEAAQNWFELKYRSRVEILIWLKIRREIEFDAKMILSYLRIFELKKLGHLWILTRDRYFELKSIFSHIKITCLFHKLTNIPRWPFELKVPPVLSWKIKRVK